MSVSSRLLLVVFYSLACRSSAETVDDLVRQALTEHPELLALEAGVDASAGDLLQASLGPNPELSTGAGLKQVDAEGGSESGYVVGLALEHTIERTGKREAREAIATAEAGLADLRLQLQRRELEIEVRRLAAEYGIAASDAEAADEINRRSQALIEMLKQRPAAGAAMFLELKMVEASLMEFQAAARGFAGQRDAARLALNGLLNRPATLPLLLPAVLEPAGASTNADVLMETLKTGPRWRIAMLEVERQVGEGRAARVAAKADYTMGPFVSQEDAAGQEFALGVSLSVPLPWRNRNQGAIAAAEAREQQAVASQRALERELTGALAQAIAAYARAREQLTELSAEKAADVHAAADLAERQYRLGTISVQLFLDMQRECLNVQQLRHDALRDTWNSALDLQELAGEGIAPDAVRGEGQ